MDEKTKPKSAELWNRHNELEGTRPALVAALERVRQDQETINARVAVIAATSIEQTNKLRAEEEATAQDVFYNTACDLEAAAELSPRHKRFIAALDDWRERFQEVEWPKLELEERRAEIAVFEIDMGLAELRVQSAQAKLEEDTANVNKQHGGVFIYSSLVKTLQQDAATAARQYHGAVDALKEAITRQEQRRAALASRGMITTRNVSQTIARY
jgi:hypothetical protein